MEMKKLFLPVIFCIIQFNCFSQKLSDKFNYKVTYELTYRLDSTDTEAKSEFMILFVGDEVSVFSSRAKTLKNSPVINGFSGHTSRDALTAFHDVIIKEEDKIYNTKQVPKIPGDHFYYIEDKDQFNWKIESETRVIEGYQSQKATTSFAGRDYTAWFTTEVPIPEGPYKFNGLPGLILEISDTKEHYVYEFIGLEKLSPTVPFKINFKQMIRTDEDALKELWYRYRRDPFTYANNPNVTITPEVHKKYVESFTKMLEKENNPIELD